MESQFDFLDPDCVYRVPGSVVFAYHNELERLFYIDSGKVTHGVLISTYSKFFDKDDRYVYRGDILWGRLGPYHRYEVILISFWNRQPIEHSVWRNLDKFLQSIDKFITRLKRDYPGYEVVISAKHFGTVSLEELDKVYGVSVPVMSDEKWEYYKRLHQARGQEKKELMKKLGLGFDPDYDPHPWHTAAKRMSYKYSLPSPWGESYEADLRALMESLAPPEVVWSRKGDYLWQGNFDAGGKRIRVSLWPFRGSKDSWAVGFTQEDEGGESVFRVGGPEKASFVELSLVGLGLDAALFDFFSANPKVKEVWIHPEAVGHERKGKLWNRGTKSDKSSVFDLAKFNAYQQMFKYSELRSRGYSMTTEGEYLVIYRPEIGQFEKRVEALLNLAGSGVL